MSLPIYHNGKILFRNGKPAFGIDCCCGCEVPCSCGFDRCCYPVTGQILFDERGMYQVGGGTAYVTDFILQITKLVPGPRELVVDWFQNGPSRHYVSLQAVCKAGDQGGGSSPGNQWRLYSSCRWAIPVANSFSSLEGFFLVSRGDVNDTAAWGVTGSNNDAGLPDRYTGPFFSDENPGPGPPLYSPCGSGASWDYVSVSNVPDRANRHTGSFNINGAAPYPAGMSCGTDGFMYTASGRRAVDSDFPDGICTSPILTTQDLIDAGVF